MISKITGIVILTIGVNFANSQCFKITGRVLSSNASRLELDVHGSSYTLTFTPKQEVLVPMNVVVAANTYFEPAAKIYLVSKKTIDVPRRGVASSQPGLVVVKRVTTKQECLKQR